jgi:uncharacterized membrane protein
VKLILKTTIQKIACYGIGSIQFNYNNFRRMTMKLTKTLFSVAAASAITLASIAAYAAEPAPAANGAAAPAIAAKEKCYGVVKAGKNDCGAKDHSCAGKAATDKAAGEFILVPTGLCDRLAGGSLKNEG